jgi:2-amino-4-hydroxy-6-hydroxymethyldihydropteridine diphosphokinase
MTDHQPWIDAYIGLGSNLDNPAQQLISASWEIAALSAVELIALSPLYASPPLGPQDQPDYVNAVAHISTGLPAIELLHALQQIENHHGRVRLQRWGARTLDLDLLLYGEQRIDCKELTVPHPQMSQRAFVLYPLADIADQQLPIPGLGHLSQLLSACPADGLRSLTS